MATMPAAGLELAHSIDEQEPHPESPSPRASQTIAEARPASIHALAWTRRPRPRAAGAPRNRTWHRPSAPALTSMSVGRMPATRPIPSAFRVASLTANRRASSSVEAAARCSAAVKIWSRNSAGIAGQHPLEPLELDQVAADARTGGGRSHREVPGSTAAGSGPRHCRPRRLHALTRPPSARGPRATRRGRVPRGTSPCGRDRDAPAPSEFRPDTRGRSTRRAAAAAGGGAAG